MNEFHLGDVVAFSGRTALDGIVMNAMSGRLSGITHFGVVAGKLLFESRRAGGVCRMSGRPVEGFQAHPLADELEAARGRVWHFRFLPLLTDWHVGRFNEMLNNVIGRGVADMKAVRKPLSLVERWLLRRGNHHSLFGAELIAAIHRRLGLADVPPCGSPAKFLDREVKAGILAAPVRLK